MQLTLKQREKLISIVHSCQTVDQLSSARKWINSLKYNDPILGELYSFTLTQRNEIIKKNLSQIRLSLKNIAALLLDKPLEKEVFEISAKN